MLKRHLRARRVPKLFEHTSKQLKRQDMNDVKSLHTLRTKNKNKKVFMPIVWKSNFLNMSLHMMGILRGSVSTSYAQVLIKVMIIL